MARIKLASAARQALDRYIDALTDPVPRDRAALAVTLSGKVEFMFGVGPQWTYSRDGTKIAADSG